MRTRPYVLAGEASRPYSDVIAERRAFDPAFQIKQRALDEITDLEGRAADATDPVESKRLQCEAEGLRSALSEGS